MRGDRGAIEWSRRQTAKQPAGLKYSTFQFITIKMAEKCMLGRTPRLRQLLASCLPQSRQIRVQRYSLSGRRAV